MLMKRPFSITPWMEVNAPDHPVRWYYPELPDELGLTMAEYCIRGLLHWAKTAKSAIITTRLGNLWFYRMLYDQCPNEQNIFGGVKTFDVLRKNFASAVGWQRITYELQVVAELTGNRTVLVDNEVALRDYHQGRKDISLGALQKALQPLNDSNLHVIWYQPEILDDDPRFSDRQAETTRLIRCVADAVPKSIFTTGFTAWPDWRNNDRGEVDRRERMIELVGQGKMFERLIVTDDGKYAGRRSCTPAESLQTIQQLPAAKFIVYPGGRRWIETAKAFEEIRQRRLTDARQKPILKGEDDDRSNQSA